MSGLRESVADPAASQNERLILPGVRRESRSEGRSKLVDSGLAEITLRLAARELEVSVSAIQDVRAAGKKVQEIIEALKNAGAGDPENLRQKLLSASDEYAKAVRELK